MKASAIRVAAALGILCVAAVLGVMVLRAPGKPVRPAREPAAGPPPALAPGQAAAPRTPIAPSATQAVPVPPQLARLWKRLDDLQQEEYTLAWRRWQALPVVEKARVILRYERQQMPSPERLASVTPEQAHRILDRYERMGEQGQRQLKEYARHVLDADELRATEKRRQAVLRQIASLGKKVRPALIGEILSDGPRRWQAQMALGYMGRQATDDLLDALASDVGYQHRAALLEVLSRGKEPRLRETFLRFLGDESSGARGAALGGLENLGPVPQEMYLRLLEDADAGLRQSAADGLGEVGDAAAIPALLEVARHDVVVFKSGFFVRQVASEALQRIAARTGAQVTLPAEASARPPRAPVRSFEVLADAARCKNAGIRQNAVSQLGYWFHEQRSLELLCDVIRRDRDPGVRAEAVSAVGALFQGAPPHERLSLPPEEREKLFDFLLDLALRDEGEISTHAFWAIRSVGWNAWPRFRRLREFFALVPRWVEANDPERQLAGALVISDLGYQAPGTLKRLLTPEYRARLVRHLVTGLEPPKVRIRFIEALGHMGERSVVPRLVELLSDEDSTVRYFAVDALGRIGDRRALPALEKVAATDAAKLGEEPLRDAAQEAIKRIRDSGAPGEP